MYVFGVDIPLVEIFFVMAVFVVVMIALLMYLIARVHQINRKVEKLNVAEKKDLGSLKAIEEGMVKLKDETEQDICLLSNIKDEINRVLKTSWKGLVIEKKALKKVHKKVKRKIKEKKRKLKEKLPPEYEVSYFAKYEPKPKKPKAKAPEIKKKPAKKVVRKKSRKRIARMKKAGTMPAKYIVSYPAVYRKKEAKK